MKNLTGSKDFDKVSVELQNFVKKCRSDPIIQKPKAILLGSVSSGKSSFLNFLLKAQLLAEGMGGEVTKHVILLQSDDFATTIKFWNPNTWEFSRVEPSDIYESLNVEEKKKLSTRSNYICKFLDLIDLPGLGGKSDDLTYLFLQKGAYDLIFILLDIGKGLVKEVYEALNLAIYNRIGKNTYAIVLLNKADIYKDELDANEVNISIAKIQSQFADKLSGLRVLGYVPISAKRFKGSERMEKFFYNLLIASAYRISYAEHILPFVKKYENSVGAQVKYLASEMCEDYLIPKFSERLKYELNEVWAADLVVSAESEVKRAVQRAIDSFAQDCENAQNLIIDYLRNRLQEMTEQISRVEKVLLNVEQGSFSLSAKVVSVDSFDFAVESILSSLVKSVLMGLGARILLAGAVPVVGWIVGAISFVFSVSKKAEELRQKVHTNVMSSFTPEFKSEWARFKNEALGAFSRVCVEIETRVIRSQEQLEKSISDTCKRSVPYILEEV